MVMQRRLAYARSNPFMTGLVTAVVLLVVMTLIFMSGIPAGPQIPGPWNSYMTLRVQLADADALAPHASVEVAGVKIGEVRSVDANGKVAIATLQINPRYSDIHSNATVYLRAHGLFGPKYIAILPGTSAAPVLQDGDTISVRQSVQPVDLDAILQDLQKPEQQQLHTFFVEFGEAAAGRGDDVNHLFAAANSLSKALQTPVQSLNSVAPQLDSMLFNDEAFNNYFAQTPLDQLVANSETTWKAFADNSQTLQTLLVDADSSLSNLDTILNGQPGNLTSIIQNLGKSGGTVDQLSKFTYLLSLFGANLTGQEAKLGSDRASIDVTKDIIAAIQNVSSALFYSNPISPAVCPATPVSPPGSANDNHCSIAALLASQGIGDGNVHLVHVQLFNWPPGTPNTATQSGMHTASVLWQGSGMSAFGSLLAS
jgi:virulence factor Mce-like protein